MHTHETHMPLPHTHKYIDTYIHTCIYKWNRNFFNKKVKARKFWWMLQRRCVFRHWGNKLSPSLIARSPLSDSWTCRLESSSVPQHRLPLPFSCTHLKPQHFPSAQAPSQSPHLVSISFSLHKMPSTIQRASPYPSKPYPKSLVSIITSPVSLDIYLTSYQNFQRLWHS